MGRNQSHVLHASAAETATGQSTGIDTSEFDEGLAYLKVTAASGTTPTLDVKFQYSDDNTNWYDAGITFAQITAASTPAAKPLTGLGKYLRAVWTIGGTTPSFTFSLSVSLEE